ncbi:hypothetical protein ACU4GD_41075 [Cupriavidus basilensis]
MQAPAGFGKTNTMLDIHAACVAAGMRTAWWPVPGAADNDFSIFLASLNVAVDALCEVERRRDRGRAGRFADGYAGRPVDALPDAIRHIHR